MPDLCQVGHYKMMASVCLSICLSVACLDLTRELKGLVSPKLAGCKPITRVTRKPIWRSKGHNYASTSYHTVFKIQVFCRSEEFIFIKQSDY